MSEPTKRKGNTKTLAEKRQELDELLAWFEGEDFELEQALEKFDIASKIADDITAELETYQNKITVLKQRFDQE
jgi:exodeoxyribonuclease VII small subunit